MSDEATVMVRPQSCNHVSENGETMGMTLSPRPYHRTCMTCDADGDASPNSAPFFDSDNVLCAVQHIEIGDTDSVLYDLARAVAPQHP